MKAPGMVTNDRAGAVDAQANYWLTKLQLEDEGNAIGVPEYNLEDGGAGCALSAYLRSRKLATDVLASDVAFELGLEIANIIQRDPFNAGPGSAARSSARSPKARTNMARLPNPYGGAVDALANYWITRLRFEGHPEMDMQPEWRLEEGGAAAALDEYLEWREVRLSRSAAFDLGFAIAESVGRDPFGAGPAVRAVLDDAIAVSWRGAVREDRRALHG